jgi:hypothetical protein
LQTKWQVSRRSGAQAVKDPNDADSEIARREARLAELEHLVGAA